MQTAGWLPYDVDGAITHTHSYALLLLAVQVTHLSGAPDYVVDTDKKPCKMKPIRHQASLYPCSGNSWGGLKRIQTRQQTLRPQKIVQDSGYRMGSPAPRRFLGSAGPQLSHSGRRRIEKLITIANTFFRPPYRTVPILTFAAPTTLCLKYRSRLTF